MHLTHPYLPDGTLFLLSSPEVTSDVGLMFAILRLLLQFAYIKKKKKTHCRIASKRHRTATVAKK